MGRTAGSGIEGAGEADLLMDGDEPNDDLLLCVIAGGFIGRARELGVPGIEAEGAGEAGATKLLSARKCARDPISGGAGLLEDIRLEGKSILVILLC